MYYSYLAKKLIFVGIFLAIMGYFFNVMIWPNGEDFMIFGFIFIFIGSVIYIRILFKQE